MIATGQAAAALSSLEALALQDSSPELLNLLALAYQRTSQHEKALQQLRKNVALYPDAFDANHNLGSVLLETGHTDEARKYLKEAENLNCSDSNVYFNLGVACQRLGAADEARSYYEKSIALDPLKADAYLNLSQVKTWNLSDPLIAQLESLLHDVDREHVAWRSRIALSLANIYFDLGDKNRAFECLSLGNSLRKQELPYSIKQDAQLFQQLRTRFENQEISSLRIETKPDSVIPIFIVGMPRSGTSLLEQILDSHPLIEGHGELPHLKHAILKAEKAHPGIHPDSLRLIREYYFSKLPVHSDSTEFIVDKMPLNFRWIGYIKLALPEAKLIHISRQAPATCWSNLRTFFAAGGNRFGNDQVDVASYYKLYTNLMKFWNERFPKGIINIEYEEIVASPESKLKALIEELSIPWNPSCLNFHRSNRSVNTASSLQVKQGVYQGSSDNWKDHAGNLKPMLEVLQRED